MDDEAYNLQQSYDRLAPDYVTRIYDELHHKPMDRELLDLLATRARGPGPICDLGCGPGQVARYLHEQGVSVLGVDVSPVMVEWACTLNPGIPFCQGDMRSLDFPDNSWGGIAAFYSLLHLPRAEVTDTLHELRRVVVPGGWLLATFHIGDVTQHVQEMWGHPVDLKFRFFLPDEMVGYLEEAGWTEIDARVRPPYPEIEYQSQRAYIFARKPG